MIPGVLLNLLGLSGTVEKVEGVITATKSAVDAVTALKELLDTEHGKVFKEKMVEIISGSKVTADGSVHLDTAAPTEEFAKGEWVFDPWKGYVWKPENES